MPELVEMRMGTTIFRGDVLNILVAARAVEFAIEEAFYLWLGPRILSGARPCGRRLDNAVNSFKPDSRIFRGPILFVEPLLLLPSQPDNRSIN